MTPAVGLPAAEAVPAPPRAVAPPVQRVATVRLALGAALLAGQWAFIAGAAWDIQWHLAVGRDHPLTPPHLLLLAGIAFTGVLALAGVLGWTRSGRDGVRFLGAFRAPLGLYLAGFGAFLAAIAFPLDDYWHRLYGLDVTIWAPFHVMIVGGMALAALGTAYTFAPVTRRAGLGASVGVSWGLATVAGTWLILLAQALDRDGILALRPQPAIVFPPLLVVLVVPWLVAAAPAIPVPGGATLAALLLTVMRAALAAFVPWAVQATALAEGLPMRPAAPPFAVTPLAFPASVILAGLLVDGLWWLAHTRRLALPTLPTLLLAGTVAGIVLAVLDRPWAITLPLTRAGRGIDVQAALVTALPAVAVCGLLGAALGAGLGAALRRVRA
ncbi:MAG TPA: hypothetical protein VHS99_04155 [Chloroflexota bacterium]|jgi:hypothetical protein|nr:hypothetical protein [Chloroflexota bacterium]